MSLIFLAEQAINLTGLDSNALAGSMIGTFIALFVAMFVVLFVISVALWIYTSLAFTAIAKKANQSSPGLAWIPGVGPLIIAFRSTKMHWWPWLLLIPLVIPVPIVAILLAIPAIIVFVVFAIIWQWKLFEALGRPGWWALLCLITPVNLILWGIAAWSNN